MLAEANTANKSLKKFNNEKRRNKNHARGEGESWRQIGRKVIDKSMKNVLRKKAPIKFTAFKLVQETNIESIADRRRRNRKNKSNCL